MKKIFLILFAATTLFACNNTTGDKTTDSKTPNSETAPGKSFVSADIDGKPWKSDGDNVSVTYNTPLDNLIVYATDNNGKAKMIFDMTDFSKTKVGSYSSSNETGKGISMSDMDKADRLDMDIDNFSDGKGVANCTVVTNIKELDNGNRLVEGTFASEMVHSYDGASKPKVQLTNGKFSVVYNTKRSY